MRTATLIFALAALLSMLAMAQPTVAPSNEQTGNPRGDFWEDYNIMQSFELGYRYATVGGDYGMYRSTVNFGDGIRLLSSSFSMQSRDGHGKYFDHLLINTQGLGNDPYESAIVRVEKNRLYRYDMMWRQNDYYDPALTVSYGEHAMNTRRRMQDHDLTLFPQSAIKFFIGYSRNLETGPALTTIQLFNAQGDEYPLFANVHREENEYRLGGEVHVAGFRLNVLHGWEYFKEDSPQSLTSPSAGNNPNDLNTLNSFYSAQPYHGSSPYWRVGIFHDVKKFFAVNGRFSYVAGRRDFALDELSSGTNRQGLPTGLQIVTMGNAQRPALTGNLTFSLFPSTRVTITNQTSYSHIRMVGDSYFTEFNNGVQVSPVFPFQYLGVETISNATDASVRVTNWFNVHGGFEYSNRRVSSVEAQTNLGDPAPNVPANEQSNQLRAGTFGFRLVPIKPLSISVDAEVGRQPHPFYPISDGNYQAFRGQIAYKVRNFRAAVFAKSNYNINSDILTSYASRARTYGADVAWTPREWFSLDASYAKLHLDTLGGIDYFIGLTDVSGESSYYVSNIHTASLGVRFNILKRADIYAGYSHVQDVGDGRATPYGAGVYTALPALQAAQTFPLRYLSPQARLSIRLHQQLRWNIGYQYYGYREDFSTLQNYRAHTGYSSLSWSF